jgi:hypothetical protein
MCAKPTELTLPEYFYRRPDGRSQNLHVRLAPPKEVQRILNSKKDFRQSTGTADLRKAKAIGARLIAEKRAEWELLISKASPQLPAITILTGRAIKDICARRLYHWLHFDDLWRYEGEGCDDDVLKRMQRTWSSTDQAMRSVIARGRTSRDWDAVIECLDIWCKQIDVPVSRTDPLYAKLVRDFAEVEMEGVKRVRSRSLGEAIATPAPPSTVGSSMSTMTGVYRDYLTESKKGKGLTTPVGLWDKFVSYMGDLPISEVKPGDVFNFLKHGLHDPGTLWSMSYTHGTVLRTLRAVFSLAISMGFRQDRNPVDDIHALPRISEQEEQQRLNPRRAYTDAEISNVFASDWYNPRATYWKGKMSTDLGARYWSPLICIFHGNRVREVMQLLASDFSTENGVDVMSIRKEIEGVQLEMEAAGTSRSVKNEATKRKVPLHPQLIKLGILDFLQSRRNGGGVNAMLFPSSIPRPGGKDPILGRAYEEAFLRYVRDGLALGRGLGNHGFRHQLEDRIRSAQTPGNQWPAGLGQQYVGRKNTRETDIGRVPAEGSEGAYGDGYTPTTMLMYIKDLDFSRVKLPPIYSDWLAGKV